MRNKVGRPHGPTPGRGRKPYDPTTLTREEQHALVVIAANPNEKRIDIDRYVVPSRCRLSTVSNSPIGRWMLDELEHLPPEKLEPYRLANLKTINKDRRRSYRDKLELPPLPWIPADDDTQT
ncbi:MAG: hypothetical protein IPG25_11940 [Proteobacteria bacterium]|nr:hypothetical protein [Pseudomonadota bacterium]